MTTITAPSPVVPDTSPRDRTGREFKVGDTIVYAVRIGWETNPTLRVAVVQEIVRGQKTVWIKATMNVTKLAVWWKDMQRKRSYIINWDEALILCGH